MRLESLRKNDCGVLPDGRRFIVSEWHNGDRVSDVVHLRFEDGSETSISTDFDKTEVTYLGKGKLTIEWPKPSEARPSTLAGAFRELRARLWALTKTVSGDSWSFKKDEESGAYVILTQRGIAVGRIWSVVDAEFVVAAREGMAQLLDALDGKPLKGKLDGPIELRDYDFITLCESHEVVRPDGSEASPLLAGTKLVLRAGSGDGEHTVGLRYENGSATSQDNPPKTPKA